MTNGVYQAGGEYFGVLNGTRYGPILPGDLAVVQAGHPEMTITGKDAAVLALPGAPWYKAGEQGIPAWAFAPWAPVDLIPPELRAAVLALDSGPRPTAGEWVAHVDHGAALPAATGGGGAAVVSAATSLLKGSFTLAGHAVPKWLALVAVLVAVYLIRKG